MDEGPLQGRTQFASDAHSMEDHLGRKAHVVAMAHFIKHPGTSTPLTVSIEGPWGSGKTSFMRQVEDELKKNGPEQPVTVWFNPWRHADGAALWAAFALELARSLRDGADFTTRWLWAPLSLWLDRPRKNATASDKTSYAMRWMLLVSVAVGLLVFLCGSLWLNHCFLIHDQKSLGTAWQTIDAWSSKGRTALALLSTASVVGVARQMWSFRETPLAAKITRLLKMETAAGEKLSETERFHDDFARMVKAYAGGRRLYVFVDDLDRCDVPKAADLMQAINLMLSGDDMNAIFILGMDREKVAAGIAVKHKDLLPYLYSRERAAEVKTTADANTVPKPEDAMHVRGLEYGYSFIEKFIQLPFRLPAAGDEGMRTYLHHLTGVSLSGKGWRSILSETRRAAEKQRKRAAAPNHPPNTHDSPRGPEESLETLTERERVMLKMDTLSERGKKIVKSHDEQQFTIRLVQNAVTLTTDEALHDAMEMILPFMENNPRRLKQALNMLRLWSYLAAEWLHSDDLTPTDKQLKEGPWLTHKKLAKVIVMELRWPTKLLDVAEKIGTNSVGQNDNRRWQNLNYLPHNIDPNRKSNSTSRDLNWHGIDKALWNAGGESAILRVIDLQAILSVAIPANRRDSEMQEKAPESDGEAAE